MLWVVAGGVLGVIGTRQTWPRPPGRGSRLLKFASTSSVCYKYTETLT
jgi:hypothetical protein